MNYLALLLLAGSIGSGASRSSVRESREPPLVGVWDVEQVAVDRQSNSMEIAIFPQDPLLLGRSLKMAEGRVDFAVQESMQCQQTKWPMKRVSWRDLFAKGFLRNTMGGRSARPTPEDYGLSVPTRKATAAYRLCPREGSAKSWWREPWVAMLSPDQIVLHYDTQVALVLRRRDPSAKPKPSYDCASKLTPTQRTICADFDLASWDRSVSQALQMALVRNDEGTKALHASQKRYLSAREACEAKTDCIHEVQWRRVDELRQEANW